MKDISREHLEKLFDLIPFSVFIKDIQDDFNYIFWNKAAHKAWGFNRIEILGKGDFHFFSLEQAQFFRDTDIDTVKKGGNVYVEEEAIQTKDGRTLWLRTWKNVLYDDGGQPLYLVGISQDITELKKAQEKIRQIETKSDRD